MSEAWEKYLKFRCTGCGNCCRDTVICITDGDVKRIVNATGLAPLKFVKFYDHDEVSMSENDPLWVSFAGRKAVMGLRSTQGRCVFLDDRTNRCGIYEVRPVTCRDHPFNVSLSDTGALKNISLSRIVKCPHEWDGNIAKRELRRVRTWNERQEGRYLEKLKVWNRQKNGPRTQPAFLRFLGFSV